ncbi:MAG: hypothetical protein C0425_04595 [Chlorobiaceae bacterium]|nr:hypothetical protein [Chlorobiaceae bacterium]MBA4309595.1 hypothetical protein [Chlorobiaceae bacterium]
MSETITFHRAEANDIDLIVDTIIEAEKSNSDKISFCNIFLVSLEELKSIFREMLKENIQGQEFCYSDYIILKVNGTDAACCSSWVEGTQQFSSAILKANLLFEYFGEEKMEKAQPLYDSLRELNLEREIGTLQIVNCYVKNTFRGMGLASKIISELINIQKTKYPLLEKAQLRITKNNLSAKKAYEKIGFSVVAEKTSSNLNLLNYLPDISRLLMEKRI